MEQFSLEKYLKNTSRKVVTRGGRPVRIVCWDSPNKAFPIVGFVDNEPKIFVWDFFGYCREGHIETDFDLFFADEEELTEFEKELQTIISDVLHWTSDDGSICYLGDKEIKKISAQIINLARKEIEEGAVEFAKSYMEDVNPSFEKIQESEELWKWKMSCLNGVNKAYTKGKEDALKFLPKWKKITEEKQNYLAYGYLSNDEYYLSIKELIENLPKEK